MRTEAQVLADAMDQTRNLTRFYLSKLKGKDEYYQFELSGKKLNSIYWLVGHLVWAERMLLLDSLEGPKVDAPWAKEFKIGSEPINREGLPGIKEMIDKLKEVHQVAMEFLKTIPNEELDKENVFGMGFAGDNSKRMMIQHAIRHEAQHIGHLSMLCKLFGEDTP